MAARNADWIVITGAPSSGKSSTISELERRGYKVQQEASRAVIEEKLSSGLTLDQLLSDGQALQRDIVQREIQRQKERDPNQLIFLDRGMGDRVAYDRFLDMDATETFATSQCFLCKAVFIMERLPLIKDGVRLENEEEAGRLDLLIERSYRDLGYEPIRIPVLPLNQRVDFILDTLGLPRSLKTEATPRPSR
jgi:predicted ATPase